MPQKKRPPVRKKSAKRRPASRRKKAAPKRRLWPTVLFWGVVGVVIAFVPYVLYLDKQVVDQFTAKRWDLPARVYARPLELYEGQALTQAKLEKHLKALGYRPVSRLQTPGTYTRQGAATEVHARAFDFWDQSQPAAKLNLRFSQGQIASLAVDGDTDAGLWRLEPQEIASILPLHGEDRDLVRLADVPKGLIDALLATEDRAFYDHLGLDPRAITRAMWANLKAMRFVQGGSTLTQQLVKNFYLSSERSLIRKANEAVMALSLEMRFSKDEILEAYLNEVFLGQQGRRAIHGFGLASRFYFGRPLQALNVSEIALLVAQVRGASYYNPWRHPERAKKRRDRVIEQMQSLGMLTDDTAIRSLSRPLGVVAKPVAAAGGQYADYIDMVRKQLATDYQEEDLRSEGLRVFTSLDVDLHQTAQRALDDHLDRLDKDEQLQGALVMVRAVNGEVVAMIGGRGVRDGAFNRALHANRQVGSLLKPVVYLAALQIPWRYTLISMVEDRNITVDIPGGASWKPQNADKKTHGWVSLEDALAHSYNLATVEIGLDVGVGKVRDLVQNLSGVDNVPANPSLLLGAHEFTPLQMAQMYQALGNGGFRAPLSAISEVVDRDGQPLQRYALQVAQAADPEAVYLVNTAMVQVVDYGTAKTLGKRFPSIGLAGKTGTTDERRDAWFAGLAGEYVGVVWVGRDDNRPARLTGSKGALPIWSELVASLADANLNLSAPADVNWHWVDIQKQAVAGPNCAGATQRPFITGSEPQKRLDCADEEHDSGVIENIRDWFN